MEAAGRTVNGLAFTSAFDSGNLASVEAVSHSSFILHTRSDVPNVPHRGTWFHFAVRCAAAPSSAARNNRLTETWEGRVLQFEVRNMNAQIALFQFGHRPVVRMLPSKPDWTRVAEGPVTFIGSTEKPEDFAVRFTHRVPLDCWRDETIYFAFCHPYSYSDCMAKLAWLDSIFDQPTAQVAIAAWSKQQQEQQLHGSTSQMSVHSLAARQAALEAGAGVSADPLIAAQIAHAAATHASALLPSHRPRGVCYWRELLTLSTSGRRIDLITITGHAGLSAGMEEALEAPLLPDGGRRPGCFPRKRVILVTSRVHPGETPASHVLDGLVEFLLREEDPRAIRLRANFVFKLIPMLNPDGVHAGKFRTDVGAAPANLNRMYARATHEAHPSIYAALAVARQLHATGQLFAYFDVHAHAGKRGCFLYGNAEVGTLGADGETTVSVATGSPSCSSDVPNASDPLDGMLFASLVAINTPHLDLDACVFFMGAARHGEVGGSGREAVSALTGLRLAYTLECNYNIGRRVNEMPPRYEGAIPDPKRCLSPPPDRPPSAAMAYGPESWRSVGMALALAAIDFVGVNPASRAGMNPELGCAKLRKAVTREWLAAHVVDVRSDVAAAGDSEDEAEAVELEAASDNGKPLAKSETAKKKVRSKTARSMSVVKVQ